MDTNLTQLKCDSSQNNWLGFVVFFGFNTFIFISLCCVISLSSEEIVWLVFKAIITCPFPFYFLVFSQMIVKNGSKWPIWSTWKVWHATGDLFPSLSIFAVLPDIRVSSFSFSCPLLQSFNWQGSKHNNLAKKVDLRVTVKCPPLDITFFFFFLATKFFYGNHFTIEGHQKGILEKVSLKRCWSQFL